MDIGAIVGLAMAIGGILLGFLEEAKFDFMALFSLIQPAAIFIVFGGTFGATILATPIPDLKLLPEMLKIIFYNQTHDELELIEKIIFIADKSRREGLLSLEKEISEIENELMKRGLTLVVDGVDPNTIKDILAKEVEINEFSYETVIRMFEKMGGYSPTMGVIGTVMGMVNILGNLGGDTTALGKSIAVAFIATFYGVAFANVVYLPLGDRLKGKALRAAAVDELVIEGVLSIQAGENPRVIKEKLNYAMYEKMKGKAAPVEEEKQ